MEALPSAGGRAALLTVCEEKYLVRNGDLEARILDSRFDCMSVVIA